MSGDALRGDADVERVTAANAELYAAIEAGDVGRLEQVWDAADDVVCVHPGWPVIRGRSRVLRSYSAIMANTAYLQFFPTSAAVDVAGDLARVSCEHSLITRVAESSTTDDGDLGETARLVSTNLFRRRGEVWKLWLHHASPILAPSDVSG